MSNMANKEFVPFPYIINDKVLTRFDQRKNIFGRIFSDTKAPFYKKSMYKNVKKIIAQKINGYSRIEFAKVLGAWAVYDYFYKAFAWERPTEQNNIMDKPELEKYPVENRRTISEEVKDAAKLYGASLVGICEINPLWIYSVNLSGQTIDVPDSYKYAIVMAISVNDKSLKSSPTFPACAANAIGYSRMAFCIACLAEFIRNLGYNAIPMGNDIALSIPLAIDAGLGELGRNGLLITPQYGPNVKICKIFTDLPLEPDEPIEFGVVNFCKKCKKCAEACLADAIQFETEPSFKTASTSNNPGILRWAVDHDKCYTFWIKNGGDCSNCIAVCPFTYSSI